MRSRLGRGQPKPSKPWTLTRRSFTPEGAEYSETLDQSHDLSTLMMFWHAQGIGGWSTWVDAPHAPGEVVFVGHGPDGRTHKIRRGA